MLYTWCQKQKIGKWSNELVCFRKVAKIAKSLPNITARESIKQQASEALLEYDAHSLMCKILYYLPPQSSVAFITKFFRDTLICHGKVFVKKILEVNINSFRENSTCTVIDLPYILPRIRNVKSLFVLSIDSWPNGVQTLSSASYFKNKVEISSYLFLIAFII